MAVGTRTRRYDAVVVGAGHNGLITAALLARKGWSVLVVERRGVVGGAAGAEEIFPGCRVGVAAQDAGLFRRDILADLGGGTRPARPPMGAIRPRSRPRCSGGGEAMTLWRDPTTTRTTRSSRHSQDRRVQVPRMGRLPTVDGARHSESPWTTPPLPYTTSPEQGTP